MNANITDIGSRLTCPRCGTTEVRGDLDTYPVFGVDGRRLIYLRSESVPGGITALYCNSCHGFITDELEDVPIE